MTRKRQLTDAEIDAELAKLDLMPDAAARREADALMKRLLAGPPVPFTTKARKPRKPRAP